MSDTISRLEQTFSHLSETDKRLLIQKLELSLQHTDAPDVEQYNHRLDLLKEIQVQADPYTQSTSASRDHDRILYDNLLTMIFVDTSGWYAAFVSSDINHAAASEWLQSNGKKLVTSDYIIDKLLTLLMARGQTHWMLRLGEELFSGKLCRVEWVRSEDVKAAWEACQRFADKRWSFTDCVSYAMMKRLGVTAAFTFDQHFHQFGHVTVYPTS